MAREFDSALPDESSELPPLGFLTEVGVGEVLEIWSQAAVDVYLSGKDGAHLPWPWRMAPASEIHQSYREAAITSLILDSAPTNDAVTNRTVLETAVEYNADKIVLEDQYGEMDATIQSVLQGLELADRHQFDGDIIIPLQPPHVECYRELEGQGNAFAIGGVKDAPASEKVAIAREIREVAGDDVYLHGLGFGVTETLADAIQDTPQLLDSIDATTPIQTARAHVAGGPESLFVIAHHAFAILLSQTAAVGTTDDGIDDAFIEDLREYAITTYDTYNPGQATLTDWT